MGTALSIKGWYLGVSAVAYGVTAKTTVTFDIAVPYLLTYLLHGAESFLRS